MSRQQYAPYIKLVRVMCTGRVDLSFVLRAFTDGADGVFIGGCHLGDCHYITHGNYHALGMVLLCKRIMETIGLDPERLRLERLSAGEGIQFAEAVNDFSDAVKKAGPLGRGEGIDENALSLRLAAAVRLVPYIRLVERERLRIPVQSEEEYHNFFAGEEFSRLFEETIGGKLAVSQIIALLKEKPRTTAEIAGVLGLTPSEVAKHLGTSLRQRFVRYDASRNRYAPA